MSLFKFIIKGIPLRATQVISFGVYFIRFICAKYLEGVSGAHYADLFVVRHLNIPIFALIGLKSKKSLV